ncbi:MAG: hypothetical protein KDK45_22640 [Leptospiraceae bacterium]|nr:hypothetical protein [Leptospiraceae bacterium]
MLGKDIYLRIWKKMDVQEIKDHLITVDDLYGTCGKCKQLGLNYTKDRKCKNCGTEFRYITSTSKDKQDIIKILERIKKDSLSLTVIEREDYVKADAFNSIKGLFKE